MGVREAALAARTSSWLLTSRLLTSMLLGSALLGASGCYRYAFDLDKTPGTSVTYTVHPATFFNGFFGEGHVDATAYCAHPVRTELKVSASDVLVSVASLLIYTPHTLEIVCPRDDVTDRR
jgi:hypothetical protein